ncbi:hypothetical protein E4U41_005551, partial [Claviceps citrina]
MLEYLAYRKVKKHKGEKAAAKRDATKEVKDASRVSETGRDAIRGPHGNHDDDDVDRAVIRPGDESFLEELIAGDDADAPAPPLPPRLYSRDLDWPSDNEDSSRDKKQAKKQGRLSALFSTRKKQHQHQHRQQASSSTTSASLGPTTAPTAPPPLTREEEEKENRDLSRVLERLNLAVKNNKVISTDSSAAVAGFTNVFKDLVNGVPTAYDDLMRIVEDRDGALARGFDKLPGSLRKLVTQLPDKITATLGPELLAAAAASQGIKPDASGGLKGAAKSVFLPANLTQLVTKPGAIVGMLRAIVGVLRTRWPAFIGMNVIWGVALSLLLFVLWYCHKRGREVRLEKERAVDGSDRIEELPDDLALPAPETMPK